MKNELECFLNLRNVEKCRLRGKIVKVNEIIYYLEIKDIIEMNDLLFVIG